MSLGDESGYGDAARSGNDGGYGGSGQTRTRLPGRGDDMYGGARRSGRSSSRSLVTVVGVVVLLIAAIAFANRGGGGSGPADDEAAGSAAAPTAPSGDRPVRTTTGGIPSGFEHSQEGAQSAAANYAVALASADIYKPARRAQILEQIFAADKVSAFKSRMDKAYSTEFLKSVGLDRNGEAPAGQTYVSRTMPVGTKATAYSDTAATTEVWCTGVFGTAGDDSTDPVRSDWFTMTLQLRWTDGDWKIDAFSQQEGPAPVNGDNKVSPSEEISKAVEEFGGFTYAR